MQLKGIELQGFKSFAGKTEIEFLNGITTIVGPNGSGKSNIADALRWVLGEQSSKVLRLTRMDDVIFSGTEARKKVGFAEVKCVIDNSDDVLPIAYKEVVVARRVFRDGTSCYLLNNNECRLKDIQELFLDTGIGKDGYSIIGQGKIDEILSTKSEDRRAIFEEASGIMKYRVKKEEALRKLVSVQNNLDRVNDILNEIETSLDPLEKKSFKAREYLKLKEELKVIDINMFLDLVYKNASKLTELDTNITTIENDLNNEDKIALDLQRAKLNIKERVEENLAKIEENQNKYHELNNENEKLNSKIELLNLKNINNDENIKRLSEEIKTDLEKIQLLNIDINKKDLKKENLTLNKIKFEEEYNLKKIEFDNVVSTLDEKELEIESLKQKLEILNEEVNEINTNLQVNLSNIENYNKQLNSMSDNSNSYLLEKDKYAFEKEDVTLELSKFKNSLNKVTSEIDNNNNEINKINNNISVYLEKQNKYKQDILTSRSKLEYLLHLEKENEGYAKSVKTVLDYSKNNSMVYSTVSSVISTDEKYEKAIEISLGGYLQNIIVENFKTAKDIIEYLKLNNLGRATFLPLDTIKKVNSLDVSKFKIDGIIGIASDLVKYDKKYIDVINLSLGNIIIMDNISNADLFVKKYKGYKCVTLDGEVISSFGSVTGGQTKVSLNLIGRNIKIKNLEKDIIELENKLKDIDNIISNFNINELENKNNELKLISDNCNIEIATINQKLIDIDFNLNRLIENNKKGIDNKLKLESEIEELLNKNVISQEKLLLLNNEISDINNKLEDYTRFNKERQTKINYLNEDLTNLQISLSSFDESNISIDEMITMLKNDVKSTTDLIEFKNKNIEQLKYENINNINDIEKIKLDIQSLIKFKEDYTLINENNKKEREENKLKLDTLELKMLESINRISKVKDEKARLETKKIKIELDIDNIKNKMWDEYEITISSAKEYILTNKIEVNEKHYKISLNLRDKIKNLGDVDVSSINEYVETKNRFEFMTSQKKDLDDTKIKLENLISNMTSLMKTQFIKQFKIINENFKETFTELFGGGKACLKLTDENNVLECGIEIEVCPPGKKLQNMLLLSGGERALSATALLFAILKIKPPPFCILDEIEAALDDVNVSRFANYIKKYSKNTQFIVITHRKGTMEVANTVYGVTMEEYGISKLISMKMKG